MGGCRERFQRKKTQKVSKEKTKPQPSNSSKNTCVLYPLQTELLLQGLTLRICVAQDGSPDLGKQLLQLWQGLGPLCGTGPTAQGAFLPPGHRMEGARHSGTGHPLLLPWSRWAQGSPRGLLGHLPGSASQQLPGTCPFGPVALSAVPDPITKVNEETWERAE